MKKAATAALVALATAALPSLAQPPAAKTQSGCFPQGPNGELVCVDPPMCFAPGRWNCTTTGPLYCTCEVPAPIDAGQPCGATVRYYSNIPGQAQLVGTSPPYCSKAGLATALSAALTNLLEGP